MDRIIAVQPDRKRPRIIRACIEVDRRADTGPCRAAIEKILTNEPGSEKDPLMAGNRLKLALCDRELDVAGSLAAALPLKQWLDAGFNEGSRDFWLGIVARLKGDAAAARVAFIRARAQLEEQMRVNPNDMQSTFSSRADRCSLGKKRRGAERRPARDWNWCPSLKKQCSGRTMRDFNKSFAMICAWAGERELALKQLEAVAKIPGWSSLWRIALESAVGSVARRSALRRNRRLLSAKGIDDSERRSRLAFG